MKLWKWQDGRQSDCVYKKLPLWYFKIWRFGFDCYILKYGPDQVLIPHKDPVENGKHYRLNIGWGKSVFTCDDLIFGMKIGKLSIYVFRPDISLHALYVVDKTAKISFGFAEFNY